MSKFPIADAGLDDRLAILGTSGSGKTYLTTTAIERLLTIGARSVNVDPLGVMWGLRLKADGKTPSGFNLPIFGGRHGDLPLNEHAGALIGETVATMRESCIVDLSELPTKAAERRFMTAFLEAVYRHTDPAKADPYHLIIDEADRFAPQKPPKGDETMLNRMEEIVRRGRAKGFIPWLITQRPAVLNKNVLSQADGLVMLKLTSSHDREQVGAWIEGQADRAQGKAILGSLPTMQRGQGVVWIPGRGILETVQFPQKTTFDSSAAPKRGEKKRSAELKPLDLGALKEKLAGVEAETKANDPSALKARIAELERQVKVDTSKPVQKINTAELEASAEARGFERGRENGWQRGYAAGQNDGFDKGRDTITALLSSISFVAGKIPADPQAGTGAPQVVPLGRRPAKVPQGTFRDNQVLHPAANGPVTDGLSRPQQRILDALAWLASIGIERADRPRVAMLASASHRSSGFEKNVSTLRSGGFVSYPSSGELALTPQGSSVAHAPSTPPTTADLHAAIREHVSSPQWKILAALAEVYPESLSREELADRAEVSALSSGFEKNVSTMRSFGFVDYPDKGHVVATPIMFVGAR